MKHHPSIETLTDYASGGLRLSHSLCISTHIEHCSECKSQLKRLERIGAEMFYAQEPVATESDSAEALKSAVFDKLFDADSGININHEPAQAISEPLEAPIRATGPKALRQFLPKGLEGLKWTHISPSIKIATLCNDQDGSQVAISCVKAGGKLPHHSHTGQELTVVLEGSFSDEDGIYKKGDFIARDAKDKHKPVVTNDAQCICLMVLDAPIEFTGFFARILNPILRKNHYRSL